MNHCKGEKNNHAKLTVEEVKEIRYTWSIFKGRRDPKRGKPNNHIFSARKLGREYGIKRAAMQSVLNGQTWKGIE